MTSHSPDEEAIDTDVGLSFTTEGAEGEGVGEENEGEREGESGAGRGGEGGEKEEGFMVSVDSLSPLAGSTEGVSLENVLTAGMTDAERRKRDLKIRIGMKRHSVYDMEKNFNGERGMSYDPKEKFGNLDNFWVLDFDPAKLRTAHVYAKILKFMGGIGLETLAVSGFGILYLYGLSSIPYSQSGRKYYNSYMVALFYFLTLITVIVVIGYLFFVMIYGFAKSRPLIWRTVIPGALLSVMSFVLVAVGVEPWFYSLDLIAMALIGGLFYNSAYTMAKSVIGTSDKKHFKDLILAYTVPLALHVIVIALYTFVIIPYYRILQSALVRAVFRMFIHTGVCQLNLAIASSFCKQYPRVKHQHLTTGVVFGIWVESAMFGRFLIATIGSLEDQIATAIAAGVVEITMRSLALKRERLVNYALVKFQGDKFEYNEGKERAYRGQFINNAMVVELASIIVVPFLLHFFYKQRMVFNFSYTTMEVPIKTLYQSALIQAAIQISVQFISSVIEYLLGIPTIAVWKQERWRYLFWEIANFVQILTLIVYVFKTLPSAFFCSSPDPCTCHDIKYQDLSLFKNEGYCT